LRAKPPQLFTSKLQHRHRFTTHHPGEILGEIDVMLALISQSSEEDYSYEAGILIPVSIDYAN
jgi:hypothetical protein